MSAVNAMAGALTGALDRLIEGAELDSICDARSLCGYSRPLFPDDASGGSASALEDIAFLIVSLDIGPYAAHTYGDVHANVENFLNSHLHAWLLRLKQQWLFLPGCASMKTAILNGAIPVAEPEKATLGTMFRAVCHSFHIGPERPSPFINHAANIFGQTYRVKLWPQAHPTARPSGAGCVLGVVSAEFQEWYFGCGRTQTSADTPQARREAEKVFITIRDRFHALARSCACHCGGVCAGTCVQAALDAVPESDYKERCRRAVDSILLKMSAP